MKQQCKGGQRGCEPHEQDGADGSARERTDGGDGGITHVTDTMAPTEVAEKVGEVIAVHVIARPHLNVDLVLPLGRGEEAAESPGGGASRTVAPVQAPTLDLAALTETPSGLRYQDLVVGKRYLLTIPFTARLNDGLRGFYRSSYTNAEGQEE